MQSDLTTSLGYARRLIVIGDLSKAAKPRSRRASQQDRVSLTRVIHNVGITEVIEARRRRHATVLAVNALAPYILTALIERPKRLVYLANVMERQRLIAGRELGNAPLDPTTAYS